jgi:hypothetical protein
LPHKTSDEVGYRAIAIIFIARLIADILSILPEEWLAWFGAINLKPIIEAFILTSINDWIS